MTPDPIRVLIVDDEPSHAEAVRRVLLEAPMPMEVQIAGSLRQFREVVASRPPHLVLLDLLLPDGRADAALISPPESGPFPMVVMTSHGDEQIAVSAIRQGALDYVVKSPAAFADMPRTVERTLREWRALRENRQAQEALRESEIRQKLALDAAQMGTWDWDVERGTTTWSRAHEALWGYAPGTFPGTYDAFISRVHPDDLAEMQRLGEQAMQTRGSFQHEYRVVWPDGSVHWVSSRGQPMLDPEGRLVRMVGVVFDVTEGKQAEEALRQERQRLASILHGANVGTWEWNIQTGATVFNERWAEMIGYTLAELAPISIATWIRLARADDLERSREALERHFRGQAAYYECEARLRHKNGSWVWVLDRGRVTSWTSDGQPLLMQGTHSDITEQKRAEARVAQEAMRTEFLLELHQRAPHMRDRELFDYVLERAVGLTGSAIGFFHQVSEDQNTILLTTWNQEALKNCTAAFDTHYPLKDAGNWVDCVRLRRPVVYNDYAQAPHQRGLPAGHTPVGRFMSIPVIQEDKVRIIFGVGNKATDYTDGDVEQLQVVANELHKLMVQRAAQDRLLRSEEEFRAMFSVASIGMAQADPNTLAFLRVNQRMCTITGYTEAELLQRKVPDITHPEDWERDRDLFERTVRGEIPDHRVEKRYIHKSGATLWVNVNMTVIRDHAGQPVRTMATVEDITQRKQLEEQLRQAQKLESIGQLAGGVAHDFNNILAAIMMHLGLLQMNRGLDPDTRGSLQELEEEARRAASLTRQLLMFSRRSVLAIKPLDLNEVIANLLKMLGRLIGEQIELRFHGRTALPPVEADAGMLEQVLMNLVVNARDAMPKGGHLTISTASVELGDTEVALHSARRPGSFVCLAVSDTGVGMNDATLQRIFEPFFTTKEAGRGTGLGLATVHGITAQHKGWVEVESAEGKGSTFQVFLPALAHAAPPAEQAASPKPLPLGQETILVVEDDAKVRRMVSQGLRLLGYCVHEAANGQDAMKLWLEHQADVALLFTDMVMPEGLTGLELAEKLQALKPGLKTIISSGYSAEIVQAGVPSKAGIVYLPKPYATETLAEVVRKCLD